LKQGTLDYVLDLRSVLLVCRYTRVYRGSEKES